MAATATTARTGRIYKDAIVGGLSGVVPSTMLRQISLSAASDSPPPGRMRDGGAAAEPRRYLHARLAPLERRVEQLRGHRLALVRPTQLAQDLSVPSPQIHFLELAASAVFCCCVCGQIPYSITRDGTSHMHLCVLSSLSALLYGQHTACVHHCSVSPCPTRASPPRARPRRAPARRRASPPSSARARSATAWFVLASTSLTPHTHTPHTNANRNTRIFSTLTPP